MKISKLFHWLYGFVMFLPILAIGSACLISSFNMSSKEETEIIYKYETNEVISVDDLIEGRIYHFRFNFDNLAYNNLFECYSIYNINGNNVKIEIDSYDEYLRGFSTQNNAVGLYVSLNNTSVGNVNGLNDKIFEADIIYKRIAYNDSYTNYSICDHIPIESYETHNLDTQDVFYRACDKVTQNSLFSWAYDSFLSAPLVYIVTLFSMPANSMVVQLLSYWLAISVIWLVFDVIMYVPLLVHRWLDKGVLE